jgi:CubicO group peptidase (beta-lactamase class C family)
VGYGYGWMIVPGQPRLIAHYGGTTGFTSVIKRYPDDKTTIIILTNQQNVAPDSTADLVAKKLFGK